MIAIDKSPMAQGTIKWLVDPSSQEWLAQALANPLELLIDHAHCERKAAGVALQLMFRYVEEPGLSEVLSPLAREELEHFEIVLGLLKSRGKSLMLLPAPPYGAALASKIRKEEPLRMLDSFLVAGLIEARSHERMSLLAANIPDKELSHLYARLLLSEAKHFGIYWTLAEKRFDRKIINSRLRELALFESEILSSLYPHPRIHS